MKMGSEGRKFSIKGRHKNTQEPEHIRAKQNVPGPGYYGYGIEMNKYGIYNLSTIENSRAAQWSPNKRRFIDMNKYKSSIPGPTDYNPSDYSNGNYVTSKFKNHGSIKYIKEPKRMTRNVAVRAMNRKYFEFQLTLILETPGPGSYMPPSEFGYLELYKNATPGTSQSPRTTRPGTNAISSNRTAMGNMRDFAYRKGASSAMAQTITDGFGSSNGDRTR